MPRAGTLTMPGGKPVSYYEISVRQFAERVGPHRASGPPRPCGATDGHRAEQQGAQDPQRPVAHDRGAVRPASCTSSGSTLVDDAGRFRPHLLPVDPTLHWANPPGGPDNHDTRPTFTTTPGPYTGPVPLVTHAHGAVGVGDESDGYAEAWYLPVANDIPDGFATEGTWFEFFKAKAAASYGAAWDPS